MGGGEGHALLAREILDNADADDDAPLESDCGCSLRGNAMSALERDGDKPFSLEKVRILLLDGEATSMSILGQILSGFGARSLQKCSHIEEAKAQLQKNEFDLIIVDPATEQGEGYAVPRWIRRSCTPPNRFCPVVMVTGHTESARIHQLRDSGANFVVAKPLTPACLYERIAWLGRDKRPYVECKVYAGPDRRFKPATLTHHGLCFLGIVPQLGVFNPRVEFIKPAQCAIPVKELAHQGKRSFDPVDMGLPFGTHDTETPKACGKQPLAPRLAQGGRL